MKPTICLDFDSVIYGPDGPVPGAMEFIAAAVDHFNVDIFSRHQSTEPIGRRAMWLHVHDELAKAIGPEKGSRVSSLVDFPATKPTGCMSLDDRAIVNGTWPTIEALLALEGIS